MHPASVLGLTKNEVDGWGEFVTYHYCSSPLLASVVEPHRPATPRHFPVPAYPFPFRGGGGGGDVDTWVADAEYMQNQIYQSASRKSERVDPTMDDGVGNDATTQRRRRNGNKGWKGKRVMLERVAAFVVNAPLQYQAIERYNNQ